MLVFKDEKRKFKPSELLKADKVSNPLSQAYIGRTIKSKENAKITNKWSRNEDMTKKEALQAKKKIKIIHYHQHYQLEVMIEY